MKHTEQRSETKYYLRTSTKTAMQGMTTNISVCAAKPALRSTPATGSLQLHPANVQKQLSFWFLHMQSEFATHLLCTTYVLQITVGSGLPPVGATSTNVSVQRPSIDDGWVDAGYDEARPGYLWIYRKLNTSCFCAAIFSADDFNGIYFITSIINEHINQFFFGRATTCLEFLGCLFTPANTDNLLMCPCEQSHDFHGYPRKQKAGRAE